MLRYFQIKNFKSIQNSNLIEFRPLTLLVGGNSSGKSSITQALLTLKQSIENRDPYTSIVTNGTYTKLGAYADFIFKHDTRLELIFSVVFDPFPYRLGRDRVIAKTKWDICFGFKPSKKAVVLKSVKCESEDDKYYLDLKLVGRSYDAKVKYQDRERVEKEFDLKRVRAYRFYSFRPQLSSSRVIYDYPFRVDLSSRERNLSEYFEQLYYLGPLRERPRRLYLVGGESRRDVGLSGEFAADVLWLRSQAKKKQRSLLQKVNEWIKYLGVGSSVRLRLTEAFQLLIIDPATNVAVNLADVGFGVSQLLPVIIQAYLIPPGSSLILEQPEIHLHPDAQAKLADMFIDAARDKNFIIETHSEHLLSRIRRRVAEGKLQADDVAIYYFTKDSEGTNIKRLSLGSDGEIAEWPQGFFEEDFIEAMEHLKVLAQKKTKEVQD